MTSLIRLVAGLVLVNALLLGVPELWARFSGKAGQGSGKPRLTVGLVFDVGGRGDKSFNDAAYKGLSDAAKKLGVVPHYVEPGDGSDRESALRILAADGADLVIGVGFIFSDDMNRVAPEYPKTKFACIDYAVNPKVPMPQNLAALKFREEEGAFLVGALASLVSRSKAVGFVGGMDIPLIHKFEEGYKAGVKHVCPECRVLVGYAGVTGEAFKNPGKGKELGLAQYDQGADIIFHASGSTGLGVFEAARLRGKLAIGVDADQWHEAPGRILTSMVKIVDAWVFHLIEELTKGRFRPGVHTYGLKEKGIDYVYNDKNRGMIPAEVRARVEALRGEIIAGKIRIPSVRGEKVAP